MTIPVAHWYISLVRIQHDSIIQVFHAFVTSQLEEIFYKRIQGASSRMFSANATDNTS